MPIFDYRCKDCSTIYDILHLGKELNEDIRCPQCGSYQSVKLVSLPGIISKGDSSAQCTPGNCNVETSCCNGACPRGL